MRNKMRRHRGFDDRKRGIIGSMVGREFHNLGNKSAFAGWKQRDGVSV